HVVSLIIEHKKDVERSHGILAMYIVQLRSYRLSRYRHEGLRNMGLKKACYDICPLLSKEKVYGFITLPRPKQFGQSRTQKGTACAGAPPITGPDQLGSFRRSVATIFRCLPSISQRRYKAIAACFRVLMGPFVMECA